MRLVSNLQRATTLVAALAALAAGAQAQTIGCELGGSGGPIPTTGTGGGGTFPGTFPASAAFTINVGSVPGGASVVTEVTLHGLTHSWRDDVLLTLTDPLGNAVNLSCRGGGSGDFIGDYTIVSPTNTCASVWPNATGNLAPGIYQQNYNTWVDGTNGVFNASIETLAAQTGVWTVTAYDWAGGDSGALVSFDLCFGTAGGSTLPAPGLSAPADLATVTVSPVDLSWALIGCATSYDVEVDAVSTNVATSPFSAAVAPGAHNWRVRAVSGASAGPWSAMRSFDFVPPPVSVCVDGGAGGAYPATGTGGGGTWPTVLPSNPFSSTYIANVPTGATKITKVEIDFTTQHTWAGDVQLVLTDPTGGMHTLLCRLGSTAGSAGLNCDLNGVYSIYETAAAWPTVCPGSGDIPAGDYGQSFGAWVSGDLGIFNTPLSAIPLASGAWTLTGYDWAGGDSGAIGSWKLCFEAPVGPLTYCLPQAPGTTNGCIPTITATGNPDVAHSNSCVLTVSNAEGDKSGLFLYSITGQVSAPWCAGGNTFRCIRNPVQRMNVQQSTGTDLMCDGTMTQDWNAYQLANPTSLGNPFGAGDSVDIQGWFRDPGACKTSGMSEAIRLTYVP